MGLVTAPKKIYVHVKDGKTLNTWNREWIGVNDVEYIRTDAFIEKACDYLNKTCRKFILTEKDIEDFKNYMKEE